MKSRGILGAGVPLMVALLTSSPSSAADCAPGFSEVEGGTFGGKQLDGFCASDSAVKKAASVLKFEGDQGWQRYQGITIRWNSATRSKALSTSVDKKAAALEELDGRMMAIFKRGDPLTGECALLQLGVANEQLASQLTHLDFPSEVGSELTTALRPQLAAQAEPYFARAASAFVLAVKTSHRTKTYSACSVAAVQQLEAMALSSTPARFASASPDPAEAAAEAPRPAEAAATVPVAKAAASEPPGAQAARPDTSRPLSTPPSFTSQRERVAYFSEWVPSCAVQQPQDATMTVKTICDFDCDDDYLPGHRVGLVLRRAEGTETTRKTMGKGPDPVVVTTFEFDATLEVDGMTTTHRLHGTRTLFPRHLVTIALKPAAPTTVAKGLVMTAMSILPPSTTHIIGGRVIETTSPRAEVTLDLVAAEEGTSRALTALIDCQ